MNHTFCYIKGIEGTDYDRWIKPEQMPIYTIYA